jgi:thiol-disulfide isomerase/thioredoxin
MTDTKRTIMRPLRRNTLVALVVGVLGIAVVVFLQMQAPLSTNTASVSQDMGKVAPAITLSTSEGQTVELPGKPGQITVLYTMGYWCSTCVPGAQLLAKLQPAYARRGVRFIAVDVTHKVKAADLDIFLQAVGDNHLTWALDASGRFAYLYKIETLETTIVVDGQGHEVYRGYQTSSDTTLRTALDKLLG